MKRIMLYILGFFIYGIIVMRYAASYWHIAAFIPVFVCALLYIKFKNKMVFCLVFVSIIASLFLKISIITPDKNIVMAAENGDAVSVEAIVKEIKKRKDDNDYYVLAADKFDINNTKINQKLKVVFFTDSDETLQVGQKTVIKAKLHLIGKNTNPYDFNPYNYYSARKIFIFSYGEVIDKGDIVKDLWFYLNSFRDRLANVYDNILPPEYASIAKAMILGEKWDIEVNQLEKYSLAGIYHILSISGLHISIICGFLVFITDRINIKYGKIAVIFILFLYALMTGGNPSTVRAVIMSSVILFRYIILRSSDFLTSIAFSCILILCFRPLMLFDIGFQYTFGAVFTIGFIAQPAIKILNKGRLISWIVFCFILSMFLKVITAYYFYGVSNIDFILNIIIIPIIGIAVISAFISGIIGLFWIGAARFLISPFYIIWVFINNLSDLLLKIPFAYMITGKLDNIVILGFLIFFALTAFALYEGKIKFKKRISFFVTGLFIFSVSTVFDFIIKKDDGFKITFLSVGQGDSAYGEFKGFNFLIDGGGNMLKKEGSDTGVNVLIPHIKGSGNSKINAVFISHTDADHVKGIIEIMDMIDIERIYISAANPENEYYDILLKKAYKYNIPVYKMKKDDYINYDNLKIRCIYPFDDTETEINDSSMVLKAEIGKIRFLFTGDIEKETESKILDANEDISCDVIKIAHHGSKTSTTEEFLDKTNSKIAVVSAGKNNMYNHPSKEVVERIENKNIDFFNTADDGAVTIKTNGENLKIIN